MLLSVSFINCNKLENENQELASGELIVGMREQDTVYGIALFSKIFPLPFNHVCLTRHRLLFSNTST